MRRIILVLSATALMVAMAMASGLSASAQSKGKGPGPCVPPGTVISEFAKLPGSVPETFPGGPPGQAVKTICAPGQQP